jgi:glycosyltransferase involved in cell wall biosynthesis
MSQTTGRGAATLDPSAPPRDPDAPEFSILMPCLNESETLAACIEKAKKYVETSGVRAEIIIADNGSTDGSQKIATDLGARVVNVPIRGYGAALYHGTLAARGQYVIMGDSDDSYDFSNLSPFIDGLRGGYDLVMGNRFMGGIKSGAMPWKNRYIGNPILTAIGRLFFHCPVRDFHCGLRGYSIEAFKRMDLRTTGMEFASEMVIKSNLLNMKMTEVPTTLSPDGRSRPPHLRPWRDGWRHLRFMFLYSPKWMFLYPGTALFVIGLALGLWVLPGRRYIGSVSFDVHTLLCAAAIMLIGFQGMVFWLFSKVFAISEGLLPRDPRIDHLLDWLSLEAGLIAGIIMILLGALGVVATFWYWSQKSFGQLDPTIVFRALIPSVFAMILGFQGLFASLFLSVLGLRVRR